MMEGDGVEWVAEIPGDDLGGTRRQRLESEHARNEIAQGVATLGLPGKGALAGLTHKESCSPALLLTPLCCHSACHDGGRSTGRAVNPFPRSVYIGQSGLY